MAALPSRSAAGGRAVGSRGILAGSGAADVPWLAGEGESVDAVRAGCFEDARGGVECVSAGEDVIEDHDPAPGDAAGVGDGQ